MEKIKKVTLIIYVLTGLTVAILNGLFIIGDTDFSVLRVIIMTAAIMLINLTVAFMHNKVVKQNDQN